MYKTIMVPTEGSGFDREAIRVALRLAEKSDAVVHLVRVLKASPLLTVAIGSDELGMNADSFKASRDRELGDLYMLAAECKATTSVTIATSLEYGPVADVLEAYALRVSPDLIVMTSHGRHGIARLSLGSVTDSLIRKAHIPVLVIKPEPSYLNPRAAERFKRMVVPLDGSPLAEQILPSAAELANLEQSEIVLLQVLTTKRENAVANPATSCWEQDVPAAHAYLNRIAAQMRHSGVAVTTDIVVGSDIAGEIAAFARSKRAELVAIATHGRSGIHRAVMGSVADELTRTAGSSLMVLNPLQSAWMAFTAKEEGVTAAV